MLTTISDRKIGVYSNGSLTLPNDTVVSVVDYYEPHMVNATDYYAFGMPSRVASSATGAGYRFGFNGKENDNEVKGFGNQQDYGMRIYDARLGRFLSVDPLTKGFPWYTPYQFAGNKPIWAVDLDGEEEHFYQFKVWTENGKTQFEVVHVKTYDNWLSNLGGESYSLTWDGHGTITFDYELDLLAVTPDNFDAFHKAQSREALNSLLAMAAMDLAVHINTPSVGRVPRAPFLLDNIVGSAEQKASSGLIRKGVTTVEGSANKSTIEALGNPLAAEANASSKELSVTTYKESVKQNAGKGLSGDHIPSFAALKKIRQEQLGRTLTAVEETELRQQALVLTIETNLHRSTSLTYGGRNTQARQAADASNPLEAIRQNVNAYRPELLKSGYTNQEIDKAIEKLSAPFKTTPPKAANKTPSKTQ